MIREVSLEEISDGKLYGINDMVKADCGDCKGCSSCCQGMGDTIILDPLDVHRLQVNVGLGTQELLTDKLVLSVIDGNVLPTMKMEGVQERCVFLSGEGRCTIHAFRPGICRLFPLGRYYENGGFQYFLQIHECSNPSRTKVKVRKWIDVPDVKTYDRFVCDWHYFLKDVQGILGESQDEQLIRNLNVYVLNRFYMKPYDQERNFYEQFYERLKEARELIALGL